MPSGSYFRAQSAAESLALRRSLGRPARYLAGGTALQLGWGADGPEGDLIDISSLARADPVTPDGDALVISAFATLEAVRRHPLIHARLPVFAAALSSIAAFSIRNLGTIGGNVAWEKGDLRPLLLAIDATIVTTAGEFAAANWFNDTASGDLILALRLTLPTAPIFYEKIGYRAAFSPSLLTVAAAGNCRSLRIAVGGGENRTGRVFAAEDRLAAGSVDCDRIAADFLASGLLADDPIVSARHRADVAARILLGTVGTLRAWAPAPDEIEQPC